MLTIECHSFINQELSHTIDFRV
uniref:Uncharacterized protein n=1 Tax=Arundo donax TaxID=35708 RepID=A0A0A9BLL6_ARUDO